MEFFTILLSALLGILSPGGVIADSIAASAIRNQFDHIEDLAVRIDSTPSYQLARGRADRVRISGKGVYPIPGIRIDTVELETDPIAVNLNDFSELKQPIQAGVRLVLTQADLNQALQSEVVANKLRDLSLDFLGGATAQQLQRYDVVNPQVEFLANDRVRFQVSLKEQQTGDQVAITGETGLAIASGKQLELVNPDVRINDESLPPELVALLFGGISQKIDLSNLQASGITARVLDFRLTDDRLSVAAFVRVEPGFKLSGN
ncbi:MAG TPA: DUF2993 domain-containing protein [Trichocoleus sp.]|jgi:hypothetical protein